MKTSSIVIAALFASAEAVKLDPFLGKIIGHKAPVYPLAFHENEDINSVPAPLSNRKYMTSTQAKLLSRDQDDLAHEPEGLAPQFREPYNKYAKEPVFVSIEDSDSDSSDSSDSDDDNDRAHVQWMVAPDFGESDDQVVMREHDTGNGVKASGWTNPLGWVDSGHDDDKVLMQQKAQLRFEESGFPTPADRGLDDDKVVNFVQIKDEDDDDSNVVTEEQERTAEQIATGGLAVADTIDGDDKVL